MKAYAPETQKLLRSIPGIGTVCSAALVAGIGDIRRFPNPEKLVAYIGLDCRVCQSGTSIQGKGYISKRGNSYLRYLLFNASFRAISCDPELREYFEKKKAEGKHHFVALCAVERKLIHRIYAIWKRGKPYKTR
jgi:transposase